jgi:ubiquinone/menaquinone biosynthesis C-methylase UbiE
MDINKERFNKQAKEYSSWCVTKNVSYLKQYYEFCEINNSDTILDIACGSGDFPILCAKMSKLAYGIDISDNLIEIANSKKKSFGIENVNFICSNINSIDIDKKFSTVVCRMALHHFDNCNDVFLKIIDSCHKPGKIGIQDVITFEDEYVHEFYEKLEKLVDRSHNKTLKENEFLELYERNNVEIKKKMILDREISVNSYISHAIQSENDKKEVYNLLKEGLEDSCISKYLIKKENDILFKRKILLVLGEYK